MRSLRSFVVLTVLTVVLGAAAHATVIVDPNLGRVGTFLFSDGVVTSIDGVPGNDLSLTVPGPSTLDLAVVMDDFVIGDEFALELDGNILTPDSSNPGGATHFFANYVDVFLSAGPHTFVILQTVDCCGAGRANYSFSAITPVPEPGSALLLGGGLATMALRRRRVGARR